MKMMVMIMMMVITTAPWIRVLLEKLTVVQLATNYPPFYET